MDTNEVQIAFEVLLEEVERVGTGSTNYVVLDLSEVGRRVV